MAERRGDATSDHLLTLERPSDFENRLRILNEPRKAPMNLKRIAPELLSQSSVLDRLKTFLPQMEQANQRLSSLIEEKGAESFDIENVSENEAAPHIQMDLALGIAELYTKEAVAAAERASGDAVQGSNDEHENDDEDEDDDGDDEEGTPKKRRRILVEPL